MVVTIFASSINSPTAAAMADAASPRTSRHRPPDTPSRRVAEAVTATHDFQVPGFSQLTGTLGAARSVNSPPFSVGGYSWMIKFFPNGSPYAWSSCFGGAAAAFLHICDGAVGVRARFTMSLVRRDGRPASWWSRRRASSPKTFGWPEPAGWGFSMFYLGPFLRLADDCLTIRCELTVLTPRSAEKDTTAPPPPPPELPRHLRSLLRDGTGADVTFDVAGREFRAHRVLLAARSPVFRAGLFGSMAESEPSRVIEVVDMEPAVFEMLLDFIYTDCLPESEHSSAAAMQHLLVAADRYGLDRLKIMCAQKLRKDIDVSTVASTLALADQHHCQLLKEACIGFMSSPKVLRLVAATDDFKQLMAIYPQLLNANRLDDSASSEK